jgi:tRNA(fMet)-specific endonuclease VapC
MYLLDTNVCINFIKGNADIVRRLSSVAPSAVFVCAIVKAELLYGAMRSNSPSREFCRVENLNIEDWQTEI